MSEAHRLELRMDEIIIPVSNGPGWIADGGRWRTMEEESSGLCVHCVDSERARMPVADLFRVSLY